MFGYCFGDVCTMVLVMFGWCLVVFGLCLDDVWVIFGVMFKRCLGTVQMSVFMLFRSMFKTHFPDLGYIHLFLLFRIAIFILSCSYFTKCPYFTCVLIH